MTMTAAIRKVFAEKPAEFYPRKYLGQARDELKKLYIHYMDMGTTARATFRFEGGIVSTREGFRTCTNPSLVIIKPYG